MPVGHKKGFGFATREMPQNHENIDPHYEFLYGSKDKSKKNIKPKAKIRTDEGPNKRAS